MEPKIHAVGYGTEDRQSVRPPKWGWGGTSPAPSTDTLGGTVMGLQGTGVVLQNGSNTVTITGSGAPTFPGTLADKTSSTAGITINPNTGALTPVPTVMNAPLDSHKQASVDRSGFFLCANDTGNTVYRYTIDPQNGGLSALDSLTIGADGGGRPVLVGSQ